MTNKVTVGYSTGQHVFLWTVFPLGGAVLGSLLSLAPGWIAALPWFPNQAKIAELAEVIGLKTTLVLIVVGVLAGAFLTLMAYDDVVTVAVDAESVTVNRKDNATVFPRAEVSGVLVDAGELVLLGVHGEELTREKTGLKPHKLRAAFGSHGYRWHEHDPYGELFTRWIDGTTSLSHDAHAILRARQTAIEKDDTADVRQLRRELFRHGVFVRDEGKRQYWRTAQ